MQGLCLLHSDLSLHGLIPMLDFAVLVSYRNSRNGESYKLPVLFGRGDLLRSNALKF